MRLVTCYTRSSDGAHALLLMQSAGGLVALLTEDNDGDGTSGIAEHLARILVDLCVQTDLASWFATKLASGKGVHDIRLDERSSLLLVPCRFESPGADSSLRWVAAKELIEPGAGRNQLAAQLSTLLACEPARRLLSRLATAAAAAPASATTSVPSLPDDSVPRKLVTDVFLGEIAAAVNEPLLRMLGITLILIFPGPEGTEGASGPIVSRASEVAEELNATLAVVRHEDVTTTGMDGMALLGECCDMLELGVSSGGALLAGDIDGSTRPGPVWVACALRAASADKVPVGRTFACCRELFPGCRMSAHLARNAQKFAAARHEAAKAARATNLLPEERASHVYAAGESRLVQCLRDPAQKAASTASSSSALAGCCSAATTNHGSPQQSRALPDVAQALPVPVPSTPLRPRHAAPSTSVLSPPRPPQPSGQPENQLESAQFPQLSLSHPSQCSSLSVVAAQPAVQEPTPPSPQPNTRAPADDVLLAAPPSLNGHSSTVAPEAVVSCFRCRKCRATLFDSTMLDSHEVGVGQLAFKPKKRETRSPNVSIQVCTSHFLLSDTAPNLTMDEDDGKVGCPKCNTRLGTFVWSGMQCSCGAWVAPAIQVVKSKVDESCVPPTMARRAH